MKGFKNILAYVKGQGIIRTNIGIEKGKIAYIGEDEGKIDEEIAAAGDALLVPGFVDQHIHGAGGADAMDGTEEALQTISATVAKEGTTAFLATTMTQSPANIDRALSAVKTVMDKGEFAGAAIVGVHLEGPFISPKHIGAQPLEYVAKPAKETFDAYQKKAGGAIKLVSLAPEVEGGLQLVEYLSQNGVVASIGHTGATHSDVAAAVKAGARNVTHTYNAQTPLHHREAGVVGSAMLFDELNCEAICDTIHVSIPALKLLYKNKPKDKFTLITDAMRAKGMPDGESELGGQKVFVQNGEARLANGALAGSVLRMNVAIKNFVQKAGVPLEEALDCASYNPAKNLGLLSDRGSIAVGKRADFALLTKEFEVAHTFVAGNCVY